MESEELSTLVTLTSKLLDKYKNIIGGNLSESTSVDKIIEHIVIYYEDIINCLPGNVYWIDKNCVTVGCNKNVLDLFGFVSNEQFKGQTFEELGQLMNWSSEFVQTIKNDTLQVIHSGKAKLNVEELPVRHNDGRIIYYLSSRVPLFDHFGNTIGIVGISIDITDRKKQEQQRLDRTARGRTLLANKAKTLFLANMKHDIKTPLSGIISTAQNLMDMLEDQEQKRRAADIMQSGVRLLDFMNELIESSKLMLDEHSTKKESFSIKTLIEDILHLLQPVILSKSLTFDVQFDEHIPEQVLGYRWHLYRILLNLISNSIKFTHVGCVAVRFQIERETKAKIVLKIVISDTGVGISKAKHSAILEQYNHFSPSDDAVHKGSGLGLYIVRRFVSSMKGTILIESEENKGSAVTLKIPFQKNNNKAKLKKESIPSLAETATPVISAVLPDEIRVLVVEDDIIAARSAQDTLTSLQCHREIASTGEEALQLFKPGKYHFILMDMGLPDMKGEHLVRELRRRESAAGATHTPIIAFSAHIDEELKRKWFAVGINDVKAKPLLKNMIQEILATYLIEKTPAEPLKIIDLEYASEITSSTIEQVKGNLYLFVMILPEVQTEMQKAYHTKNIPLLLQSVGNLYGGLMYCGLPKLEQAVVSLESSLRTGNLQYLDVMYQNVCQEIEAFIAAYHELKIEFVDNSLG